MNFAARVRSGFLFCFVILTLLGCSTKSSQDDTAMDAGNIPIPSGQPSPSVTPMPSITPVALPVPANLPAPAANTTTVALPVPANLPMPAANPFAATSSPTP